MNDNRAIILRRAIIGAIRRRLLLIKRPRLRIAPQGFYCGGNCSISGKNTVTIGKNFFMGNCCHLAANVRIGNDVVLASYVSFVGGDHKIDYIDVPIRYAGLDRLKMIVIGSNVWIGHGAIVLHGVTIEDGAVVAAGSVVTKPVHSNEIVAGNPAKHIRYRR